MGGTNRGSRNDGALGEEGGGGAGTPGGGLASSTSGKGKGGTSRHGCEQGEEEREAPARISLDISQIDCELFSLLSCNLPLDSLAVRNPVVSVSSVRRILLSSLLHFSALKLRRNGFTR